LNGHNEIQLALDDLNQILSPIQPNHSWHICWSFEKKEKLNKQIKLGQIGIVCLTQSLLIGLFNLIVQSSQANHFGSS
jgi:hypothetical protein